MWVLPENTKLVHGTQCVHLATCTCTCLFLTLNVLPLKGYFRTKLTTCTCKYLAFSSQVLESKYLSRYVMFEDWLNKFSDNRSLYWLKKNEFKIIPSPKHCERWTVVLITSELHSTSTGAVAKWLSALVYGLIVWGSSPGTVILLCSWARHFTLTVPLSTQLYKWHPLRRLGELLKQTDRALGRNLWWTSTPSTESTKNSMPLHTIDTSVK